MSVLDEIFRLSPGSLLGDRYRLERCLGDGSFGYVWKAERLSDHAVVAVKIPKHQSSKNADLEEGRALLGQPQHSNVITINWMGRVPPERSLFAIEMEFFNSNTLAFLLDSSEQGLVSSYSRLLGLYEQVLDGVVHLHSLGIAHGDIKPQNILVGGDRVKVTDFGCSLLVQDSYVRTRDNGGTILYSPPEFAGMETRRRGVDAVAHDVYSMGVLLYQILTGRLPHDTLAQVVRYAPFPRPSELCESIVRELDQVIMTALSRDPKDRWTSMQALREAFGAAKRAQLASHGLRTPAIAIAPAKDWSSRVLELMGQAQWREAGAVARREFDRNADPHAFLMMVRAAMRDERYFDALDLVSHLPTDVANSPVRGDLDAHALEAFIRTEKVNEAARMIDRCIELEGETPGLLLRKASLMGLQARFQDASEILVELNRRLPRRASILSRLVLVFEQLRDLEQADAFRRALSRVELLTAAR